MNELIELYERKLKAIQPMIESAMYDEYTEREIRLRAKASCYRTFLSELKQQCNRANVVGQSEQLVCDVCGSDDVIEAPHVGRNCNRCNPL
jgi:hypothetical protein